MAKLPDNVRLEYVPVHEIENCRWDEEAQMYRVTVDGRDYQSYPTSERMREVAQNRRRVAQNRRRDTAAYEAMARCAEARENRQKEEDERRDRIRAEVMREARYFLTDEEGYQSLGRANPHAQRLVDIAVEARMKLEEQS